MSCVSEDNAALASDEARACADERVVRYAEAEIPTADGPLRVVVFREVRDGVPDEDSEHIALVVGDPLQEPDDVLVRVHSECITSEVFGSLKCDCREQLHGALAKLRDKGAGIIVYLRQEGRGIGLGNKIRAYALQARGYDTVEANHQLGFDADLRTYDIAGGMLADLGVSGVSLMTNNPDKLSGLNDSGVRVVRRVPLEFEPHLHNAGYLATKRARCGHLLEMIVGGEEPAE